jgi:hypothetical protein
MGSITDLLTWFSPINLFIFERKPCNQVSGVRCPRFFSLFLKPDTYMSPETKKSWIAINKLVMHPFSRLLSVTHQENFRFFI